MAHKTENEKQLTFTLAGRDYAIDIRGVREILGRMEITPLPQAPRHVLGVINLRGRIVPVSDLRLMLGMAPGEPSERNAIIVVDSGASGDDVRLCAALVDEVSEVTQIPASDIESPPAGISTREGEALRGVAKLRDRVVMLLGTDRLFRDGDAAASGVA